ARRHASPARKLLGLGEGGRTAAEGSTSCVVGKARPFLPGTGKNRSVVGSRDRENNSLLRSVKGLRGFRIHATDGDIGQIHDCYFDDHRWTIRYLSVGVGHWLPRRHVLIPLPALRAMEETGKTLHVALTKAQVRDSPGIDTDKPVSRQHDIESAQYFGLPYDWHGPALRTFGSQPAGDAHLSSARVVIVYSVKGVD